MEFHKLGKLGILGGQPDPQPPRLTPGLIVAPDGFTLPIPFDITFDGTNFTTDLDITDFKIIPVTEYFVTKTGSNGNDGLTLGNAKADADGAIVDGNATNNPYQILIQGGTYNRTEDWSITPTQDCNIIGENGTVILSSQEDGLSFVADGAAYKATRSVVGWVYDQSVIDSNGDYERLTNAASIAACQATAGSWFTDNVEVWVHTTDSRDLSVDATDIRVYLKVNPPKVNSDVTVYIENLNIEGFQTANFEIFNSGSGDTIKVYANTCSFKYCIDGNAIVDNGAAEIIWDTCDIAFAFLDGFNYHIKDTIVPDAFEVNCTVRQCGHSGVTSNNASSMHDGGRILRINGTYKGSEGRNIHDISLNTEIFNIACNSNTSRDATDAGSVNFQSGDGAGGQIVNMWLLECESSGSNKDLVAQTDCNIFVNIGNNLINGNNTIASGATIETYEQITI